MRRVDATLSLLTIGLVLVGCSSVQSASGGNEARPELQSIEIEDVQVQVGVGSPIPVDIFISGTWPELCSQVSEIRQTIDGYRIEIEMLANPSDPGCPEDRLGLPFRIAIPLNVVELPEGEYTIGVNGVFDEFEWTGQAEPSA